jgi:hypothetical protein
VRDPDGTIATLDVPRAAGTVPLDINNSGAITGIYYASKPYRIAQGFLFDPHGNSKQ